MGRDRRRLLPVTAHPNDRDGRERRIFSHRGEYASAVQPRHPVVQEHGARLKARAKKVETLGTVARRCDADALRLDEFRERLSEVVIVLYEQDEWGLYSTHERNCTLPGCRWRDTTPLPRGARF